MSRNPPTHSGGRREFLSEATKGRPGNVKIQCFSRGPISGCQNHGVSTTSTPTEGHWLRSTFATGREHSSSFASPMNIIFQRETLLTMHTNSAEISLTKILWKLAWINGSWVPNFYAPAWSRFGSFSDRAYIFRSVRWGQRRIATIRLSIRLGPTIVDDFYSISRI